MNSSHWNLRAYVRQQSYEKLKCIMLALLLGGSCHEKCSLFLLSFNLEGPAHHVQHSLLLLAPFVVLGRGVVCYVCSKIHRELQSQGRTLADVFSLQISSPPSGIAASW